jgi:hypothetical protein
LYQLDQIILTGASTRGVRPPHRPALTMLRPGG